MEGVKVSFHTEFKCLSQRELARKMSFSVWATVTPVNIASAINRTIGFFIVVDCRKTESVKVDLKWRDWEWRA
jgi:hypothetical protein